MPTAGTPVALNYGYNWLTGTKLQYYTLSDTGNPDLDWTRVGMWLLGEGEMDGLIELWDNVLGRLMLQPNSLFDNPQCFQFHPGCDSVIGSGLTPISTGGDQGVDVYWENLPAGLQPLHYNRWAYYTIRLKTPINNLPTVFSQEDPQYWTDLNPIGLWRGIRCRTFDANGTQNGYAFTRNPAWHYVDLRCRRKLFPEYGIDAIAGADELPAAVAARFDFGALAATAAYFDEVLADTGRARFCGDYSLSQTTTLQANITQMLACCRAFERERAGTFSIVADKPRASVFTFTRKNADSFLVSDTDNHAAANLYVGKFRDLLCPVAATIASITCPDHQLPHIETEAPHCFAAGDYIVLGNTGTVYDGYASVNAIDAADVDGNSYGLTLNNLGSNVPATVGSGGLIGLRYSRFKDRAPQFNHKAHQLARGGVGIGIARQRNRVSLDTDFSNSTWDQVARVTAWQMGTALGPNVAPYVSPPKGSLKAPLFAVDAAGSGAVALQIEPGDVVTIDDTLSFQYAGLYEVVTEDVTLMGSDPGEGTQRTPKAGGLALTLRPYDPNNYPDTAPAFEPGWADVPILPGNAQTGTEFPLADGFATFISGSGPHGSYFQLPDGYSASNILCWASPQGYIEGNQPLQNIEDCDAYSTGLLSLTYSNADGTWNGPVNWSAICWRTSGSATVSTEENAAGTASMTYVELTLLGGEKIVFGKGLVGSGFQVPLPAGYTDVRTLGLAFAKSAIQNGTNDAHGFCAYIDPGGIPHHAYQDGEGNRWEGVCQAMVFSYKNNLGTWMKDANGWCHTTLPGGKVLAIAGFSIYSASEPAAGPTLYSLSTLTEVVQESNMPLMANMPTSTMQIMAGESGFDITDNHAHGVQQCYVQEVDPATFVAACTFEDGEGNSWGGATSAFMLLYDTPTGAIGSAAAPAGGTNWPGTSTAQSGSGTGGGVHPIGTPIEDPGAY